MVHLALLASSLGALAITAVSAASGVCTQPPYAFILPLSNYAPAESFCSSKYPLKPCTTTSTTTSTSVVSLTVATSTCTLSTSTVTSTVATTTMTVTTAIVTSTTTTDITTITSTTDTLTVTTYDATSTICTVDGGSGGGGSGDGTAPPGRRDLNAHLQKRDVISDIPLRPAASTSLGLVKRAGRFDLRAAAARPAPPTWPTSIYTFKTPTPAPNPQASLFSNLAAQAAAFASTACSCIETPKPCTTCTVGTTTVSTTSVTATISVVATSTTSVTDTSTISTDTTTTTSVQGTTTTNVEATTTIDGGTTTTSAGCLASCTNSVYTGTGDICFNNYCDQSATTSGATGSSTANVGSLQECVDACALDLRCNVYSFDGHTNVCTLYDDSLTVSPSSNPGDAYGVYDPSCT